VADNPRLRSRWPWLLFVGGVSFAIAGRLASADDLVTMRGNYYLEHSTRVVQPSVDIERDLGTDTTLDVHYLLDSITSASSIPNTNPSAASGVAFSELRNEVGLGILHNIDTLHLNGNIRFSDESDYRSTFGTVGASLDLFGKNTTLAGTFSYGHDIVTQPGRINLMSFFYQTLDTEVATVSVTQIVTPTLLFTLDAEGAHLRGFQSNQYRYAYVAGNPVVEDNPRYRLRGVLALGVRYAFPSIGTAVAAGYRFYRDDWRVTAHTPTLEVFQRLSDELMIRLGYRYYTQSQAYFYEPIYDAPGPGGYVTADPKLSPFTGATYSGNLDISLRGLQDGALSFLSGGYVDLLYEYIVQHNRYGNANQMAIGLTFPY
jgi:hypothetical protein